MCVLLCSPTHSFVLNLSSLLLQEKDFGGWPEQASELLIKSMTAEHARALAEHCSTDRNVAMSTCVVQQDLSLHSPSPLQAKHPTNGVSPFTHPTSLDVPFRERTVYQPLHRAPWWWVPRSVVVVVVVAVVAARRILPGMQKRPANKPWRCIANGKKRRKKWVVSKPAAKTLIYNQLHEQRHHRKEKKERSRGAGGLKSKRHTLSMSRFGLFYGRE